MGTSEFAVASLSALLEKGLSIATVVTAPDKPAGRGRHIKISAVKAFARDKGLPLLQPQRLTSADFVDALTALDAELFVVVAFRMLPEVVWKLPKRGTVNLHASLLPHYRGAAPINWAIINGETMTGATVFFIQKEIDTGAIIDAVRVPIAEEDTAESLHHKLMKEGALLLAETVPKVLEGDVEAVPQREREGEVLPVAPKIFKPDGEIDWRASTKKIHDKIRGLSPYPAAWTRIEKEGVVKTVKLFASVKEITGTDNSGTLSFTKSSLKWGTADGWIAVTELQLEGKKRMSTEDFLKGFQPDKWKLSTE